MIVMRRQTPAGMSRLLLLTCKVFRWLERRFYGAQACFNWPVWVCGRGTGAPGALNKTPAPNGKVTRTPGRAQNLLSIYLLILCCCCFLLSVRPFCPPLRPIWCGRTLLIAKHVFCCHYLFLETLFRAVRVYGRGEVFSSRSAYGWLRPIRMRGHPAIVWWIDSLLWRDEEEKIPAEMLLHNNSLVRDKCRGSIYINIYRIDE